jgi:hypothetical protein
LEGDVSSTPQPGPPISSKQGLCNATVEMPWACKSRSGLGHYWLCEWPLTPGLHHCIGWLAHASCGAVRQRIISTQLSNKSLHEHREHLSLEAALELTTGGLTEHRRHMFSQRILDFRVFLFFPLLVPCLPPLLDSLIDHQAASSAAINDPNFFGTSLSFTQQRLSVHKLRGKTIPPRGIVPPLPTESSFLSSLFFLRSLYIGNSLTPA